MAASARLKSILFLRRAPYHRDLCLSLNVLRDAGNCSSSLLFDSVVLVVCRLTAGAGSIIAYTKSRAATGTRVTRAPAMP